MIWKLEAHRELLKISMLTNTVQSKLLGDSDREILLLSELTCKRQLSDDTTQDYPGFFHLVTLINREPSARNIVESKPTQSGTSLSLNQIVKTETNKQTKNASVPLEQASIRMDSRSNHHLSSLTLPDKVLYKLSNSSQQNRTLSRVGPTYTTDSDAGSSLRFTTSELVFVTVSWLSVVLLYTFCLLIYIRSTSKTRMSNKSNKRTARQVQSEIQHISQPFNLQMSDATKTRLNMMLRQSTVHGGASFPNQADHKLIKLRGDQLRQSKHSNGNNIAHNTLNAVRALRLAAADLARSKLRQIRYRPNLMAIPEVDNDHIENYAANQSGQISSANLLNSLIENALDCDCPHLISKRTNQGPSKQRVETLFARPSSLGQPASLSSGRVSRQGIICKAQTKVRHQSDSD